MKLWSKRFEFIIYFIWIILVLGETYNTIRFLSTGTVQICGQTNCKTTKTTKRKKTFYFSYYSFDCTKVTIAKSGNCENSKKESQLFIAEKLGLGIFLTGNPNHFKILYSYHGWIGVVVLFIFLILILYSIYFVLAGFLKLVHDKLKSRRKVEGNWVVVQTTLLVDIILYTIVSLTIIVTPLKIAKISFEYENESVFINGILCFVILSSVIFGPYLFLWIALSFRQKKSSIVKIIRNILLIFTSSKLLHSLIIISYKIYFDEVFIGSYKEFYHLVLKSFLKF